MKFVAAPRFSPPRAQRRGGCVATPRFSPPRARRRGGRMWLRHVGYRRGHGDTEEDVAAPQRFYRGGRGDAEVVWLRHDFHR